MTHYSAEPPVPPTKFVHRVSQLLLLQPCITLVFAALIAGESLGWIEIGFTILIVAIVAIGRRMPIRPGPAA